MKKSENYEVIQVDSIPKNWISIPGWNWEMNDSQIAKHLGVSRQAVWSYRKLAKAPRSPQKWIQRGTFREKIISLGAEEISKLTVSEVAKLVGCSRGRASYVLNEEGLQPAVAPRHCEVLFPAADDYEAWAKSNEELAFELETTPGYVSLYRWRKGIPSAKRLSEQLVHA